MENERKQPIIVLIVLVLIALIGGYFLGKSNLFSNQEKNNNESNEKNLLKYEIGFEKIYDIYEINYNEMANSIIGYNNKMYLATASDMGDVFNCVDKFTYTDNGKNVEDGFYECNDDEEHVIREFNINPSNISKVVLTKFPYSSDAQFSIFFINLDGKVDYFHYGEGGTLKNNVLKDYKVKDIKYECIKSGEIGCDKPQLILTLKDGTTKNINNFEWE